MRTLVTFFCPGVPQSQNNLKVGRGGNVYHGNPKLMIWRASVGVAAQKELPENWEPYKGACELQAAYLYERPKSGPNVTAEYKTTVPDTGNLDKALEDALSDIVYADDRQIVKHETSKRWVNLEQGEVGGVLVQVIGLE